MVIFNSYFDITRGYPLIIPLFTVIHSYLTVAIHSAGQQWFCAGLNGGASRTGDG